MEDLLSGVAARIDVQDLVTRLFVAVDEGRWADAIDCFGPKVLFDVSSTGTSKPTRTTPKKVVESWEASLKGLSSSQHRLSNFLVQTEGEEGSAFCYSSTTHFFPNPTGANTHTINGTYDLHFVKDQGSWKIDALRFNQKCAEGNPLLSELARKASRKA